MFQDGANIPGEHHILEGQTKTWCIIELTTLEDVNNHPSDISDVVKAWCDWKDK